MDALRRAAFLAKSAVMQPKVRSAYRGMLRAEKLDPEMLARLQDERARAIVTYAFEHSGYYQEKYRDHGLSAIDLRDPDAWAALPVLAKEELKGSPGISVMHRRQRDKLVSRTGGSTGEPLAVEHDRRAPIAAMWWRAYGWWGVSPGDNSASIYRQSRSRAQSLKHAAEWWPTRSILLNARGMTDKTMHRFAEQWRQIRPRLLTGYVDGVHQFAKFVETRSTALSKPAAVAVTASVLQEPQRVDIERIFGAAVYDCYRSAEVPWIAAQCRARVGLHIMSDIRRVEVLGDDGAPVPPGVVGDVVITDLTNFVYPLIRYRIGDRASLLDQACTCGLQLPLMSPIDGRQADMLKTPSGRLLTGGSSGLFNRYSDVVTKFQILQREDYSVVLRVVARGSVSDALDAAGSVSRELSAMLGDEVMVTPEVVPAISHVGGKSRLVVSEVPDP